MRYAILCYHDERGWSYFSKEQVAAVMGQLDGIKQKLIQAGKLGPSAQLLPTTAAATLRKDREPPMVIDGPFAATKEQQHGFYLGDCASLDEAIQVARDLGQAVPGGAYEIRPIRSFSGGAAFRD